MKIYDCFMFFDEEMLLDLRLNIMDKYVDKFVITEATYMHSGKPKKLLILNVSFLGLSLRVYVALAVTNLFTYLSMIFNRRSKSISSSKNIKQS